MFDGQVILNTAFSILYQLTDLCSNCAVQLNQMSDISEVSKNLPLKYGFRSISQRI